MLQLLMPRKGPQRQCDVSAATCARQEKVKCRSGQADPDELDAEDSRLEVDGDVSDVQSMSGAQGITLHE